MVLNVTSLSGNGLRDWLVQRLTSVMLAVYIIFIVGFLMLHSPLQYDDWKGLFTHNVMKIFSVLFLLSLCLHAWIGIWTVITDYIKCSCLRLTLYAVVLLALLITFVWGIAILWSV